MSNQMSLNLALVGCGYFGKKRASAIKNCANVRLTHLFDVDPGKSAALSQEFNAQSVNTIDQIATNEQIHAVFVAVDNPRHAEACVPMLRAHKSVLCEKPLAHSIEHGRRILEAAKDSRGIFKLGSNLRFFAAMQKAKQFVDEGRLGRLKSATGTIGHNGQLVKDKWYQRRNDSGGGTLLDNGSHLFDLFTWFFGPLQAKKLTAHRGTFGDVEDFAQAELTNSSKMKIDVIASWARAKGYVDLRIEGDAGALLVDTDWPHLLFQNAETEEKISFVETAPSAIAEMNYFFNCIRNGQRPSPSVDEAMKVLELIHELYSLEQNG